MTGLTGIGTALVAKRLELLKEMVPRASRVLALRQPGIFGDNTNRQLLKETEDAGRSLGVHVEILDVRNSEEVDATFLTITSDRADALVVDLTTKRQLPTMCTTREQAEAGALMAYGPSILDSTRRAAD